MHPILIKTNIAMEQNEIVAYPRYILGLDISTACIGICVVKDNGDDMPEILYLSHKTPKVNRKIKGFEALCLRKKIFEEEFINEVSSAFSITDVVIEEPLLSSNNVNTVATLLRYNGMISEMIYRVLGVVPNFISSYDARTYSFPELVAIRKYNKKGVEYPKKHILNAIKNNKIVLFGSYPFDVDKKTVMMNMVNEKYKDNPIPWVYDKDGNLRKENFDACDSLICALAFININHHGVEEPKIIESRINDDCTNITYTTKIWDKTYTKNLFLSSSGENK